MKKIEINNELLKLKSLISKEFYKIEPEINNNNHTIQTVHYRRGSYIYHLIRTFFELKFDYEVPLPYSIEENIMIKSLSARYYNHKDILKGVLSLAYKDDHLDKIYNIVDEFKMPFDWEKDKILQFLEKPHYVYRHSDRSIGGAWGEGGLSLNNCPYYLIFRNDLFLQQDIFDRLIDALQTTNNEYLYLILKERKDLTKDQIKRILNTITYNKVIKFGSVLKLVFEYKDYLSKELLDILYKIASKDNYAPEFILRYPEKYIKAFMLLADKETISYIVVNNIKNDEYKKICIDITKEFL